jgi:hypothetical protein
MNCVIDYTYMNCVIDYTYMNCVMTRQFNPDNTFTLPDAFVNAAEKWLIMRECWCSVQNGHLPINQSADDIRLHASCVDDLTSHNYVALCNSVAMKKKKFRVKFKDHTFTIRFKTIDGLDIHPEQYIMDFLLKFR